MATVCHVLPCGACAVSRTRHTSALSAHERAESPWFPVHAVTGTVILMEPSFSSHIRCLMRTPFLPFPFFVLFLAMIVCGLFRRRCRRRGRDDLRLAGWAAVRCLASRVPFRLSWRFRHDGIIGAVSSAPFRLRLALAGWWALLVRFRSRVFSVAPLALSFPVSRLSRAFPVSSSGRAFARSPWGLASSVAFSLCSFLVALVACFFPSCPLDAFFPFALVACFCSFRPLDLFFLGRLGAWLLWSHARFVLSRLRLSRAFARLVLWTRLFPVPFRPLGPCGAPCSGGGASSCSLALAWVWWRSWRVVRFSVSVLWPCRLVFGLRPCLSFAPCPPFFFHL